MANDDFITNAIAEEKKRELQRNTVESKLVIDGRTDPQARAVDADTSVINGVSYRKTGFNAPETGHTWGPQTDIPSFGDDYTQQNEAGVIASELGYNTGSVTGTDAYGRKLLEQTDAFGKPAAPALHAVGAVPVSAMTDATSLDAARQGSALFELYGNKSSPNVWRALAEQNTKVSDMQDRGERPFTPLYTPRDEKERAALDSLYSPAAIQEKLRRLDEISKFDKSRISKETQLELDKEVFQLKKEVFYGKTPEFGYTKDAVRVSRDDRYIDNTSKRPWSDAYSGGMMQMQQQLAGIEQSLGDAAKIDFLSKQGRDLSRNLTSSMDDMPSLRNSPSAILKSNSSPWNKLKDSTLALGYITAASAPNAIVGGLSSMVAGPVAGLVPLGLLYGGGSYDKQPESQKDMGIAYGTGLGQAALEMLSLHALGKVPFIGGLGKPNLFNVVDRGIVVEAIRKEQGLATTEAAEKLLSKWTEKQIIQGANLSNEMIRKQYLSKGSLLQNAGGLFLASAGQAGQEVAQQALQDIGDRGTKWRHEYWTDPGFKDKMFDNALGGAGFAVMGHIPARTEGMMRWQIAADAHKMNEQGQTPAMQFQTDNANRMNNMDPNGGRGYESVEELAGSLHGVKPKSDLHDMESNGAPIEDSVWNDTKEALSNPLSMVQQLVMRLPSIRNADGSTKVYVPLIRALLGESGVLPGNGAAVWKQNKLGELENMMTHKPEEMASMYNTDKSDMSTIFRSYYENYWKNGKVVPGSNVAGSKEAAAQQYYIQAEAQREYIKQMKLDNGIASHGALDNPASLWEASEVDTDEYAQHKGLVVEALGTSGLDTREATRIADALVSGDPSRADAARAVMSERGIFHNPAVRHLFKSNIFDSVAAMQEHAVGRVMHQRYFGENGSKLAYLLQQAKDAGEFVNDKEYEHAVRTVRKMYDIATGNYHSMKDKEFLDKMSGYGCTLTMLATLTKSGISAQVETLTSTLASPDVVEHLATYAKVFAKELTGEFKAAITWSSNLMRMQVLFKSDDLKVKEAIIAIKRQQDEASQKYGPNPTVEQLADIDKELSKLKKKLDVLEKGRVDRAMFRRLGYTREGYNSKSKFEYADGAQSRAMSIFARAVGLKATTDSARIAFLSTAADTFNGYVSTLMTATPDAVSNAVLGRSGLTVDQFQAFKMLQGLGIDINALDRLVRGDRGRDIFTTPLITDIRNIDVAIKKTSQMTPDQNVTQEEISARLSQLLDEKAIHEQVSGGLIKFVDTYLMNPQFHNVPAFYSDPRLRIFTSMTRFMGTTTATFIPKLYRDYIIRGNKKMQYKAFSTIILALLGSHLVNILKDNVSYGGDSPYVKGRVKRMQRDLATAGLLGQGDRILEMISPTIQFQSNSNKPLTVGSMTQSAANAVVNSSPVLSQARKLILGVGNISNGNIAAGGKQIAGVLPLVGSVKQARDQAGTAISGVIQ